MPCKKKRFVRIRAVDVGRVGHHYLLIGIKKKKGKRGGRTAAIKMKKYKKRIL